MFTAAAAGMLRLYRKNRPRKQLQKGIRAKRNSIEHFVPRTAADSVPAA